MNVNRFKQLLESTMGNVRPLISEQETSGTTQPVAAGGGGAAAAKTVTINGKQIETLDANGKPKVYGSQLSDAYNGQPLPGGGTFGYKGKDTSNDTFEFIAYNKKRSDMDEFVMKGLGLGNMVYKVDCEDIDKRDKVYSEGYRYYKKGEATVGHLTPINLDKPTKLMIQRYCRSAFPDSDYPYYSQTPKFD